MIDHHQQSRIEREGTQFDYLRGYNDAISDAISWIKRHHAHIQINEDNLFGINLEHFEEYFTQ